MMKFFRHFEWRQAFCFMDCSIATAHETLAPLYTLLLLVLIARSPTSSPEHDTSDADDDHQSAYLLNDFDDSDNEQTNIKDGPD